MRKTGEYKKAKYHKLHPAKKLEECFALLKNLYRETAHPTGLVFQI